MFPLAPSSLGATTPDQPTSDMHRARAWGSRPGPPGPSALDGHSPAPAPRRPAPGTSGPSGSPESRSSTAGRSQFPPSAAPGSGPEEQGPQQPAPEVICRPPPHPSRPRLPASRESHSATCGRRTELRSRGCEGRWSLPPACNPSALEKDQEGSWL